MSLKMHEISVKLFWLSLFRDNTDKIETFKDMLSSSLGKILYMQESRKIVNAYV
jgi:hypothetical protein